MPIKKQTEDKRKKDKETLEINNLDSNNFTQGKNLMIINKNIIMKYLLNRNKAKVTIIGKAKDPYLSISFTKGIEDIQILVLMGSNMEQAYFALDINDNISFVSNQVYNNYNESTDFEFVSNSSSHFVYGEFNLTGNLIKDSFTVATFQLKMQEFY